MANRRSQLLELLAAIVEHKPEADSRDAKLDESDRRFAATQLAIRRDAVKRIEKMLNASDEQ